MTKPLVPWIGGKRKLASEIIPLFPEHTCYVEPFCGAAALFFMKDRSKSEVLNDINLDLINLYRIVTHHAQELYAQFRWCLSSRDQFQRLLKTNPESLTDIQRAARFLYLQKLAFGGKVDGQSWGTATTARPKLNILTLERDLEDCHQRLEGVHLENKDWAKLIAQYDRPHTLFYCDPPYWQTEGYGVKFDFDNYERLAELARTIKGSMIISINGHPDIKELFKGFPMKSVNYKYTVSGGGKASKAVELIIANSESIIPKRSRRKR
ncbi:MAG: restriction endonuclease subunit M [SAR86 cluster bacterium]|uniref:site-specific DNA-methyltransferase (adenine-specific) n=1 Tax=SAR86 cluster bacterium TaxID=2030880 RepID=A0A2A5B1J8_9GAMM|nr:MAG: restriction endonuclease subunit M [SAR86 cluster bacterium]